MFLQTTISDDQVMTSPSPKYIPVLLVPGVCPVSNLSSLFLPWVIFLLLNQDPLCSGSSLWLERLQSQEFGVCAQSKVIRDYRFGSKVGQIGPAWDKYLTLYHQFSVLLGYGTFEDMFSVHIVASRLNVLKYDLKVEDLFHFGVNMIKFVSKSYIPASDRVMETP